MTERLVGTHISNGGLRTLWRPCSCGDQKGFFPLTSQIFRMALA
jgi:hypothetical protein